MNQPSTQPAATREPTARATPRSLDPDQPVRWGVLATGRIAGTVTRDLQLVPADARVVAVGSRVQEHADAFAHAHHVPRAHGSYEALVTDPEVDAVYVATPHSHHVDAALLAIAAGKHVLCEKPLTASPTDTDRLLDAAASAGVFLMEAMWTRCNPLIRQASALVGTPDVGAVRHLSASFGFPFDGPPEHRLLNPALAGGAILDLGPYPVHMADLFLGAPSSVATTGTRASTGVDAQAVAQWTVDRTDSDAAHAQLMVSIAAGPTQQLSIVCEHARIDFPDGFVAPRRMTVSRAGDEEGATREFVAQVPGSGYTFQAQEVARCLRAGLTETPLVPWASTRRVARALADWQAGVD